MQPRICWFSLYSVDRFKHDANMSLLQKSVCFEPLEFKASKAEEAGFGEFTGYASIFGNVDNGKDICVKGCFKEGLKELKGNMPLMFWMHDQSEPIGEWKSIEEDDRGLKVTGQLWVNRGIPRAEQAYQLLRSKQGGLSIGYKTKKATYNEKSGTRNLVNVHVKETSVVTMPMNELAKVISVKGEGDFNTKLEQLTLRLKKSAAENALKLLSMKMADQPRDENGRWTSGGAVTSAADASVGSHIQMRGPLNMSTGTGPIVTHTMEVTAHTPATIGRGTVVNGKIKEINGMPADQFLAADKVYSRATPEQRDRLINSARVHESHFQNPANKAVKVRKGPASTVAEAMAKSKS